MKWQTPIELLNNKITIELVGCGGTGSFIMGELSLLQELLTRLGHPGLKVTAWDGSVVREANLGRQRFRVHDLGSQKSHALISAENNYNGFAWVSKDDFNPETSMPHSYGSPVIVITAVDVPSLRRRLGEKLSSRSTESYIWIDAGNDHQTGQVILGGAGLPNAYDLFKDQYANMDDDTKKSCSSEEALAKQDFGVNATAARIVGQLLWKMLRHGGLNEHGAFFDVSSLNISPMPIDPQVWLSYGYQAS